MSVLNGDLNAALTLASAVPELSLRRGGLNVGVFFTALVDSRGPAAEFLAGVLSAAASVLLTVAVVGAEHVPSASSNSPFMAEPVLLWFIQVYIRAPP